MITYKSIEKEFLRNREEIPMTVYVTSEYLVEKINNGLGGLLFKEVNVPPYTNDFGKYAVMSEFEKNFDVSNWKFFMAFDGDKSVGAATLACKTPEVRMLDGREDLCVLWDVRVAEEYKHKGIGQKLFDICVEWAKSQGYNQMKIECQNNNVPACKFYHKQGAVLSAINEYAYYDDNESKNEIQFIWYLDL